jgi:peptidoglycan/LPS O-acetylase OafA/YrhL
MTGFYQAIARACGGIPSFTFPVSAAATIALASVVSWVTFTCVEAPGMALGRRIAQHGFRKGLRPTGSRATAPIPA